MAHPAATTPRSGPTQQRPVKRQQLRSSFNLQNRLFHLFLGLIALGSSLLVAGCGGIVANGKSTNETPGVSDGSFRPTPSSIQFGNVNIGGSSTIEVSLINSSSSAVIITQISSSNTVFSADGEGTLPVTLGAGQIVNVNVHFAPTLQGASSASLTISSNSLYTTTVTLQLSGTGIPVSSTPSPTPSPTPTNGPALSINASSVTFGSVAVGTPSTQSVILTSAGTSAVTVKNASVKGTGFSVSGATFPDILNPGQTATLNVQFQPSDAGTASGQLVISSNSTNNPTVQINLSGTGSSVTSPPPTAYAVDLSWNAPSGTIAGYNVYRAPSGSSSFEKLNSSIDSLVDYSDSTVLSGDTYQYYVTSVDNSGDESVPSNIATVAIP
jgi:Abnormal spindle-like microcephaly-assoc'd, ASPM-SPD-2-Hydin